MVADVEKYSDEDGFANIPFENDEGTRDVSPVKDKGTSLDVAPVGSCARLRFKLRGSLYAKRDALTVSEHHFLEKLLEKGDENDLGRAVKKLNDDDLFSTASKSVPDRRRSSTVQREQYLDARRKAMLHDSLWSSFEAKPGGELTPQQKFKRGVRRLVFSNALSGSSKKLGGKTKTEEKKEGSTPPRIALKRSSMIGGEGFENVLDFEMLGITDMDEEEETAGKTKHAAPEEKIDAWDVLQSETTSESKISFRILGTSATDEASHPHVMSPPLMKAIQAHMPHAVQEENFWMKFSLVKDGASLYTLMQRVRASKFTVLAVETLDGEVFGSFTSAPWRKTYSYFGSGESFLWRMRRPRSTTVGSLVDQAFLEGDIDVYKWTGKNDMIQVLTNTKIAMGGGEIEGKTTDEEKDGKETSQSLEDMSGVGFMLDDDLLQGTSSPCATFDNPRLCQLTQGSIFDVANLEVWAMTPSYSEEDAQKMELAQLFRESNELKFDHSDKDDMNEGHDSALNASHGSALHSSFANGSKGHDSALNVSHGSALNASFANASNGSILGFADV